MSGIGRWYLFSLLESDRPGRMAADGVTQAEIQDQQHPASGQYDPPHWWLILWRAKFEILVSSRRVRLFANRDIAIHGALERKATDPPIIIYYQLVDGSDNPVAHSGQVVELYVVIENNDTVIG